MKAYDYIKTLKYNYNYGFSKLETHGNEFIGVPYKCLYTPIKKSFYTNIYYTIIATMMSYIILI